jgi:hypothetical protein
MYEKREDALLSGGSYLLLYIQNMGSSSPEPVYIFADVYLDENALK